MSLLPPTFPPTAQLKPCKYVKQPSTAFLRHRNSMVRAGPFQPFLSALGVRDLQDAVAQGFRQHHLRILGDARQRVVELQPPLAIRSHHAAAA